MTSQHSGIQDMKGREKKEVEFVGKKYSAIKIVIDRIFPTKDSKEILHHCYKPQ